MITLKCKLSLSKKLRALIGNNKVSITLISDTIVDGLADANIILPLEEVTQKSVDDLKNSETSIMLTVTDISDGPSKNSETVSNIFSSDVSNSNSDSDIEGNAKNPISRLATFSAPDSKKEVPYAIKSKEQIKKEVPKEFEDTKNPRFAKYVTSLEQLTEAIRLSENKTYGVDVSSIQDPRKRAVAMEAKEKAEAIDYPAFVVNDKCANLTINDLGINLLLNVPYNLENVSAKRLAVSKDIKAMFRAGMLKFIAPDQVKNYVKMAEDAIIKPELEVFGGKSGSARKALAAMGDGEDDEVLNMSDMDAPTEQERLLRLVESPIVDTRDRGDEDGVRFSTHGAGTQRKRSLTEDSEANKAGLKTIKRSGINWD